MESNFGMVGIGIVTGVVPTAEIPVQAAIRVYPVNLEPVTGPCDNDDVAEVEVVLVNRFCSQSCR
jgi:hypothetical protein